MVVEKNGITYDVTDTNQISAFLNNGWKEFAPSSAEEKSVEDVLPTVEEVGKMKVSELKELAVKLGLDATLSGAKLRPLVIEKLKG